MGDVVMLAPLKTEVCPAWHLRDRPPHPVGGQCRLCRRDVAMARRLIAHRGLDGATWAVQRRFPGTSGRVRRFLIAVQAHIDLKSPASKGDGLDTATRYGLDREP